MTLAEARRIVLKKYPEAFGWRQFSVSDYEVKSGPDGERLAVACYATDAWVFAATACSRSKT